MRTRTILAALPLLFAAAPLAAQQKPAPTPKPVTPAPVATPAPKPEATTPKPAVAQAPAPAPAIAPSRAIAAIGQRRTEIEITGGVGASIVDLNSWAGGSSNGSSMLAYWGAARVLFPVGTSLRFGVEAGYHYHFWYTSSSGQSWNYNYPVAAAHVAALVRMPLGTGFTFDVGGAVHLFAAGAKPGILAALSYRIPIGRSLVVPIGVRTDFVFTSPMVMPVVLNAGLGFSL